MKFDLITPATQPAALENVRLVSLPGDAGDFGVMAGHMPLISTLRDGETVEVVEASGKRVRFTVKGAFADVKPGGVTVLAESASAI